MWRKTESSDATDEYQGSSNKRKKRDTNHSFLSLILPDPLQRIFLFFFFSLPACGRWSETKGTSCNHGNGKKLKKRKAQTETKPRRPKDTKDTKTKKDTKTQDNGNTTIDRLHSRNGRYAHDKSSLGFPLSKQSFFSGFTTWKL